MKEIRETSYLTLEDVADWLEIKPNKVGLAGGTKADETIQNLVFLSKLFGENGNAISIEYLPGGVAGSEDVALVGKAIQVTISHGVSTANQIRTAIEADAGANALVAISANGSGATAQVVQAKTYLSGGVWSADYEPAFVSRLNMLINNSCGAVERYIGTCVLAREFTADYDGMNSNVIVPRHWPIRQLLELKIDYGRDFAVSSDIDASNYFLRGEDDFAKRSLLSGTPQINIVGSDVVLFDQDEKFYLGKLMTGSVLGSIRLKYKAGWGIDVDSIPDDIIQATMMLVEYWYFKRSNRDIGIKSKGVMGQAYTSIEAGLPKDVTDLLDLYKDPSFGDLSVPQRSDQ